VDWIHLAQDRVYSELKLGIIWLFEQLLAFHKGLCSMDLDIFGIMKCMTTVSDLYNGIFDCIQIRLVVNMTFWDIAR
jgi:hypothetical protein